MGAAFSKKSAPIPPTNFSANSLPTAGNNTTSPNNYGPQYINSGSNYASPANTYRARNNGRYYGH